MFGLTDILSFNSLRITSLIIHFIATTFLLWTPYDSIGVTLSPNYSSSAYRSRRITYFGIIALGLLLMIFEFLFMVLNGFEISLLAVLHLGADLAGIFFVIWIFLDGLEWQTYIYILCFCV